MAARVNNHLLFFRKKQATSIPAGITKPNCLIITNANATRKNAKKERHLCSRKKSAANFQLKINSTRKFTSVINVKLKLKKQGVNNKVSVPRKAIFLEPDQSESI